MGINAKWKRKDIRARAKNLSENWMHLSEYILNEFVIFHFTCFEVVDTEKLVIDCFESEDEAVEFCMNKLKNKQPS